MFFHCFHIECPSNPLETKKIKKTKPKKEMKGPVCCIKEYKKKKMTASESNKYDLNINEYHHETSLSIAHSYINLIAPCEECSDNGSSWCCTDCQQVYCHTCFSSLHATSSPFSLHSAVPLLQYTPEQHKSYQTFLRDRVLIKGIIRAELDAENRKREIFLCSIYRSNI